MHIAYSCNKQFFIRLLLNNNFIRIKSIIYCNKHRLISLSSSPYENVYTIHSIVKLSEWQNCRRFAHVFADKYTHTEDKRAILCVALAAKIEIRADTYRCVCVTRIILFATRAQNRTQHSLSSMCATESYTKLYTQMISRYVHHTSSLSLPLSICAVLSQTNPQTHSHKHSHIQYMSCK